MSSPRGKNLAIFGLGAMGYSLLELAWRKRTHWTMALTGGACLVALCKVNQKMGKRKVLAKSLAGAGCITAVEFAVGCVVNKKLNMGVWDYSDKRFNLLGQICPLYTLYWFLLCIPLCPISQKLNQMK
ncbi:hypothetical protein H8699_05170 [Christensenellaceae bacterium NSJ-44]|uniref:Uncharacterized protein n=1 Tax=Luoshenia tenuis TaxID=2763654 RepID=A0A926CZK1_9FIRM|nr:putative ABC transporter permease [Luoshenia tenuis]MBC8528819.1 hypothetical protein [Luoshenia tenuis]